MRIANKTLKMAIAKHECLFDISDVYTLRDAGRRFGVARNTVVRWSDTGLFVAKRFNFEGKSYRYYTKKQCEDFEQTEFYRSLPKDGSSKYTKVSSTVHDFNIDSVVFTPAEFADKLGISVQSVNRMDRNGKFRAFRIVRNNRTYKYYTLDQYNQLINSNIYKELNHIKNSDLIGTRIGKLEIVSYSDEAVQKGYYGSYVCKCDCGNVVTVPRSELLAGKAKSCGCKFHDLTGKDFGWWHVDGQASFVEREDGQKLFRYHCTCVCGRKSIVFASSLRSGHSQSCGCREEPIGESHIRSYLNGIGLFPLIDNESDGYIQHKTYSDLTGVGGNKLSYDFYIRYKGQEWLIEYQGQQHYRPVDYFGGESQFTVQKEHDKRKRNYASNIGIQLIEISYKYATYDELSLFLKNIGIV